VHGHLDVVPPQETGWTYDPFGGVEADGFLWGRGAVDMKGAVAAMLATQMFLARHELAPRRDVTFAYFADEERGGELGSKWLVEHRPDLFDGVSEALGEAGGFTITLPDGSRVYPLQAAEKGMLWTRLAIRGSGGHAALSDAPNPTVRLARLIQRIGELGTDDPPPEAFLLLVERLGKLLGSSSAEPERVLGLLGAFGAMSLKAGKTTFAPTVAAAGVKVNIIPDYAEVYVDCRYVPGGLETALAAIRSVLEDDMTCEVVTTTPGVSVPCEGPLVDACRAAVETVDPGAHVIPWALPAGTDAQQLTALGIRGYGFLPLVLPAGFDHLALFHAADERVPVDALVQGAKLLQTLVASY
jgi:acetylornithine deacetylase/succinyl-diaminopimelate desuccinylase-like protein